jgi:ubiquinone/menaquinone biosynthesis C-methylase UbiE
MSKIIVKKFWHLGNYKYTFYRFLLEGLCYKSFEKSNLNLLDAGCGPDVSSLSHVPEKAYFVGIDTSAKNISESKRKTKDQNYQNMHFMTASITNLPLQNGIFDIIICCDVLEHIEDKQKAINEIARICKKEGTFVGSTTNLLNPIMMLDSFLPKKITRIFTRKFAGEHYERHSRFTVFTLIQLLNKTNFLRSEVRLLGFPPFQPWIYEYSDQKPPWFAQLWIALDKLTNTKPFNIFKEIIVFLAKKE